MRELNNYDGQGNFFIHSLSRLIPENLPWSSLYWIFAFVFIIMLLIIGLVKLPAVELKEEERTGAVQTYINLFRKKHVVLFFLGIMAYVGTEQGIANWMSKFLNTYHGIDPQGQGAAAISWFWGLMTLGCLTGLVLLKLMDSKRILKIFTILTMITLIMALFGPAEISLYAFPATGFLISMMWAIIFSLALNSEKMHHGSFSGILCSGIFGGALVPLIIGWLGDHIGLRLAMLFLFVTLGYILSVAFWAKPIINNKTVNLRELIGNKK
jgi:fucose permease